MMFQNQLNAIIDKSGIQCSSTSLYRKRKNDARKQYHTHQNIMKMEKTDLNNTNVICALNILQDYVDANGWGLFCSGHWTRHHTSLVRNALIAFRKKDNLTIDDILNHFTKQLECETTNPCGSLVKRLNFIAEMSGTTFNLCLRKDLVLDNMKQEDKEKYQSMEI